jgi:L,D-peptidoglycan transpeptidase YkuD (ErfK/YbiS/YcfS/YnhG family)
LPSAGVWATSVGEMNVRTHPRCWSSRIALTPLIATLLSAAASVLAKVDAHAGPLDSANQLIVSIAPAWDASSGKLQRFERSGGEWKPVGPAIAVLYGKNGLVWGRGILGTDEPGPHKAEKDKRAPAGVFRVGKIYTYDSQLPKGSEYPYHTVTKADAWVDDPGHPQYNQHVVIDDPANPPAWFDKQKMRHGDFAYRWLVEIRHNSDPPIAGAGSAIFFHIRRGPQRPSAGCTTMAEENLLTLIRWLRAGKNPHYALLPREEYLAKWKAWGLPSPEVAAAVVGR